MNFDYRGNEITLPSLSVSLDLTLSLSFFLFICFARSLYRSLFFFYLAYFSHSLQFLSLLGLINEESTSVEFSVSLLHHFHLPTVRRKNCACRVANLLIIMSMCPSVAAFLTSCDRFSFSLTLYFHFLRTITISFALLLLLSMKFHRSFYFTFLCLIVSVKDL